MRSVKSLVAAGAASLLSSVAFAADMPSIMPPPPMYAPPPVEDFGGWYLRGDIGFSNQQVKPPRTMRSTPSATPRRLQQQRASTPPASSASASVISSTTGSAPTSPANIAAIRNSSEPITCHLTRALAYRRRHLSRHQVRMGRSRQRLCRSRHLVVHDAVHRRRRRRRAGFDRQLHRPGLSISGAPAGATASALRRQRLEVEFCLGAACRSRLQGHAELHGRTRLSLSRYG